jgi:rRNA maturation RNase YbeY
MSVELTKRRGTPPIDRRKLQRRAQRLLAALDLADCELSLLLADDAEMRALNRDWRGRDRTTDVLAFAQREGPGAGLDRDLLGDVVICLPQAERQARRRGAPLWDELLVLLVHGVLHLIGRDHEGVGRRRAAAMRREQRHLVERLRRLDRP